MLFASIFAALLIAAPAVAVPVVEVNQKRCDPTDTDILQYALTLEHLENAFCASTSLVLFSCSLTSLPSQWWPRNV